MRKFKLLLLGLFILKVFSISALAQDLPSKNPKFDKELANRLGGNEHGMKQYVFVFLKRGKATIKQQQRPALLKGHMDFIGRLAKEGKLVLAGPFADDQDVRGIYIFDVRTVDEVKKLIEGDPSIKAGLFEVEMRPWLGTAALLEVLKIHEKIVAEGI